MDWLLLAAVVLLPLTLGLLVWGFLVEPRWLEVVRFRAPLPHLPPGWQGRKVAILSDFQIGAFGPNQTAAGRAIEIVVNEGVDLMLFAGDFVYDAGEGDAERGVGILRPVTEAGIPTFAVLGNHDYRLNMTTSEPDTALADEIVAAADACGVRVLFNEHVAVPAPEGGAPLMLVGVGSEWAKNADVERAFEGLSPAAPRLVLLHHPNTFLRIPANQAPLAVAGHTHGGQIRLLPFVHEIKLLGTEFVVDGWGRRTHGAEGNRLYVNRGIGFSWLPMRIGARPELTIIELDVTDSDRTPEVERVVEAASEERVPVP